jgi:uncharacterized protein YgbK (DUF1537 family)
MKLETMRRFLNTFPTLLILGDDLTGTCVAAAQFANYQFTTLVSVNAAFPLTMIEEFPQILGINTHTRALSPSKAYCDVFAITHKLTILGSQWYFKFFDSNLRGNISNEITAVLDALNLNRAIIIPGTPQAGRVVKNGMLFIHGVPAHLTDFARDPLNPLRSADVSSIIQLEKYKSVMITLSNKAFLRLLKNPRDARTSQSFLKMIDKLWSTGHVLIFDAPDMRSIRILVQHLWPLLLSLRDERVLLCGSVGLARAVAQMMATVTTTASNYGKTKEYNSTYKNKKVIIVSGSMNQTTLTQLKLLIRNGYSLTHVNPNIFIHPSKEIPRLIKLLIATLQKQSVVILTTVPLYSNLKKRESYVKKEDKDIIAQCLPHMLGYIVRGVIEKYVEEQCCLIIIGGMTAFGILNVLGAELLQVEKEKGFLVFNKITTGPYKGIKVITKGGAAGSRRALLQALNLLGRDDA